MNQLNWDRAIEQAPEEFEARMRSVLQALPEQEEPMMKHTKNVRRIVVLAAAAVMVLGGAVFASNNFGYMKNDPETSYSLKNPAAVEAVLEQESIDGITSEAKFLESYSNGFTFAGANVEGEKARGENDPTEYKYQNVETWYERDGATVYVRISPIIRDVTDHQQGTESTVGDVTVYALRQDYLVVPEDYVKTDEQKTAEAAGDLVFSYDADLTEPEAMQQRYVSWFQDGMRYSISAIDSQTELEELIGMAQELIDS